MPFEDAIRALNNGIILEIEVTPGSKRILVPAGYNEWRKRIEVKLTKNAQKGKANEELIANLAKLFRKSSSEIKITSGATSSKKSVFIKGISLKEAILVLEPRLKKDM